METQGNGTLQERPARFGFPTYTSDVQAGAVVPGVYGPVKLDIGGLLLGTIVGLGAFFILPKLLHVAAPYGPYKRSEDEEGDAGTSISDIFARVQESLNSYNVDSTACMQRAVCYSIQAANEKTNGTASSMDNLVENIAKNDLTKSLIDGTDWKKAVDVGEGGGDCSAEFPRCPFSLDSVASAIAKYLIS
ncbi:UNVERIFIED_CONTAM: hypothetical protein PYX00_007059 [Menopon gallinae]|uniref:Uncharacterized protein n=1 Tax=Menopon gallinae TaxID=328185 RepID=A0AAW2HHD4_9NEOP